MEKSSKRPNLWELLIQSLQDVEGGYDLLAPKFDQSAYITPEKILEPFFFSLEKEGPFEQGLDLCCGTGAATLHLLKQCQQVTGVDLSKNMLAMCRDKIASADYEDRVELVQADALNLPFDQKFDIVVSFGAFGHILEEQESELIDNIYRALKPDGKFCFITTSALPWHSFSHWMQRGFNLIMRVRNYLIKPPFIMYYLTFRLPHIQNKLEEVGFQVAVRDDLVFDKKYNYLIPLKYFKMVVATK